MWWREAHRTTRWAPARFYLMDLLPHARNPRHAIDRSPFVERLYWPLQRTYRGTGPVAQVGAQVLLI